MIKKEKIVITIVLVVSCITATPVAAKNVENNTYQICRNDIFIDWYQLNCKKIISEIKDDGCYIAVNLGDWLKEQDIYDISVTEDNESEGYKKMYYERNPEKEEKDEFYDTDDTAYIPFESYGVVVSEIVEKEAMEYNLGGNTILWFSMVLIRR